MILTLFFVQYRHERKVLILKEEGDSSAINQAYDKEVSKSDKREQRDALSNLCNAQHITQGVIDQWKLFHA